MNPRVLLSISAALSLALPAWLGAAMVSPRAADGEEPDSLAIRIFRDNPGEAESGITHVALIRDLAPAGNGDSASTAKLRRFAERLEATDVFTLVRIRDTTGFRILELAERRPGRIALHLRWEIGSGPGVGGMIRHLNLGGRLWEGLAEFRAAEHRQSFIVGLSQPLPLGLPVRVDIRSGYRRRQDTPVPRRTGAGALEGDGDGYAAAWVSRTAAPGFRVSLGGIYRTVEFDRGPAPPLRSRATGVLGSAEAAFLDEPLDPSAGVRLAFSAGAGGAPPSRNARPHAWAEGELAGYLPSLGPESVLAARIRGGSFAGDAGLDADRFQLGGPYSVRGYREGSVCPEKTQVDLPEGPVETCAFRQVEPAFMLLSAEWRLIPIPLFLPDPPGWLKRFRKLKVIPFGDYGLIWNRRTQGPGQGRRARSAGAGFEIPVLGVTNVRLDLAAAGIATEDSRFAWSLALDQAF